MTREELIERIENANKTPIEVDDMWINMVYTVYPNFSSDMLLAAKRVANTFSCLDLDIDVDKTSIWFKEPNFKITIRILNDRLVFVFITTYFDMVDVLNFSNLPLTELLSTKEG